MPDKMASESVCHAHVLDAVTSAHMIINTALTIKTLILHIFCIDAPSLQQDYKKQMLTAAHALAVDAKNLLDVIDQSRLKMMAQSRPH